MDLGRVFRKISAYRKANGTGMTVNWLWNCFVFKVRSYKQKLFGTTTDGTYNEPSLSKYDKKTLILNQRRKVFIFASVPYYDIGGGQRSSQLAKVFAKLGWPVYYIYGFHSNESKTFNLQMPMIMHQYADNVSPSMLEKLIEKDDLTIFESPVERFGMYLDVIHNKGGKVVYENIDNWQSSLGSGLFKEETLHKMLRAADLLVGTAKPLVAQLEEYCKQLDIERKIVYLPNAVDDEMFSPLLNYIRPTDLVRGKKTLLYYGSLWGEWFAWDILTEIATKNPSYSINLIGDYQTIPFDIKKLPKNIHFLGLKRQFELPAYLKYTDYAMIPFTPGKISDYVSPLKIFEYISMNTRVLCTELPDVKGYPNTHCGNTAAEWEAFIKQDTPVNASAAGDFISRNTWCSRIESILDVLYPAEAEKCIEKYYEKISVVTLNYNNKGIIDRCVDSLLRNNARYHYEVVVVDNDSRDGSYEQLQKKYGDKITLVRNDKNGCASGRNLGVKSAKGDYVVFLDSDQWVIYKYWLDVYLYLCEQLDNVGLISWSAGWFNSAGKAYHVVESFPYRYMPPTGICRCDIGYLGSGGMIIERALFEQIGGFDEAYDPTCYEDTDISLKVRHAGREIFYSPYVALIHLPHQTTKAGSTAHKKLTTQKQLYFTAKWKKLDPKLLDYTK